MIDIYNLYRGTKEEHRVVQTIVYYYFCGEELFRKNMQKSIFLS